MIWGHNEEVKMLKETLESFSTTLAIFKVQLEEAKMEITYLCSMNLIRLKGK